MEVNTRDLVIRYAAGYLDAEGCIRDHNGPDVCIQTCFPRTLRWLQSHFGGTVQGPYRRKGKKRSKCVWRWVIRNDSACEFLVEVVDNLKEKEAQARLMLLMWGSDRFEARAMDKALRALKRISYDE